MKKTTKYLLRLLIAALVLGVLFGSELLLPDDAADMAAPAAQEEMLETPVPSAAADETQDAARPDPSAPPAYTIDRGGSYDQRDDVALYIHTYGCLPGNYITKSEAEAAGWSGGSVEKYCPGKCIGGGRFGNYEGALPDAQGRTWTECDINTLGASSRGAERIVFSNDGLIYYTPDHYDSFQLLYGSP